jgi:hypothetical protein
MGRVLERLDDRAVHFIGAQKMFFVATAPSGDAGLLNLSPKGLDTFAVIDDQTVAYLDLVGSGIETVAHLRQNGRIVLMLCAFEGAPNILRIYGKGEAIEPGDAEWDGLRGRFPEMPGARSVIRVRVERVSDSCGFAAPLYRYEGDRSTLLEWAERKGPEAIEAYKAEKNRESLDGLPGLRRTGCAPSSG